MKEVKIKYRIVVQHIEFEPLYSEYEARTAAELAELHAGIRMIFKGEVDYLALPYKGDTIYIGEEILKKSIITVQMEQKLPF